MIKGIDFTGVSVVFFCHDGKGKFLLSKRSQNARDEKGKWDIGGGGLRFGETVHDGLLREVMEEYGAQIQEFKFLGYRDVHREHEGKRTHWIALDFKVLVDPFRVRNCDPEKIEEIRWFTFENIPAHVHSQLFVFIDTHRDLLQ